MANKEYDVVVCPEVSLLPILSAHFFQPTLKDSIKFNLYFLASDKIEEIESVVKF